MVCQEHEVLGLPSLGQHPAVKWQHHLETCGQFHKSRHPYYTTQIPHSQLQTQEMEAFNQTETFPQLFTATYLK